MKRLLILLTFVVVYSISFGQENETNKSLQTKKGFIILPQQGDIAIGFNAVPVIDFFLNAVNIMNNTGQTAQHPGFVKGCSNIVVVKYYLNDDLALRLKFGLNTTQERRTIYFYDPSDVFNNPGESDKWDEIKDVSKIAQNSFFFALGSEMRKGHNRLQGFAGGEFILGFGSEKTVNTWGVEMNQEAITNGYTNGNGSPISPRILYQKSGLSMTTGLRGFLGVEYYVLPKISIGAEFGLGMGLITTPRGETEVEYWDSVDNRSETDIQKGPNSSIKFIIGVDDGISSILAPSSALTMFIHF